MIRTVTDRSSAKLASLVINQKIKVAIPEMMATMVSTNAALSAKICTLDLDAWASATKRIIPARAVSSPSLVTFIVKAPSWLIVPAITSSPTALLVGLDSPVMAASFTDDLPSVISPSVGILVPGRTRIRSLTLSSLTRTLRGWPLTSFSALSGNSCLIASRALSALATDAISSQWPKSIMVTSVASSQKNASPGKPNCTATL